MIIFSASEFESSTSGMGWKKEGGKGRGIDYSREVRGWGRAIVRGGRLRFKYFTKRGRLIDGPLLFEKMR